MKAQTRKEGAVPWRKTEKKISIWEHIIYLLTMIGGGGVGALGVNPHIPLEVFLFGSPIAAIAYVIYYRSEPRWERSLTQE